jgi:hypothetical protein
MYTSCDRYRVCFLRGILEKYQKANPDKGNFCGEHYEEESEESVHGCIITRIRELCTLSKLK